MSDSKDEYKAKFPLHYAVMAGNIEEVKLLLEKGGKIYANLKDLLDNTPLHYALQKQPEFNVDDNVALLIVNELLNIGADVYLKGAKGNTPLHNAASYNRTEAVKILLERGANPFLINQYGKTPAYIAGAGTDAKELLENAERKQRSTNKLISAICCGNTSSKRLNKLIEKGGDINGTTKSERYQRKNDGENVLTHLTRLYVDSFAKRIKDTSRQSHLRKISRAISLGVNPYKCDDHGNSTVSIISNLPEGYIKNKLEKAMGTKQPYKCDEHGNVAVSIMSNLTEGNVKIKPKEAMGINQPSASGVKRKYGNCDQEEEVLSSDEAVLPDLPKDHSDCDQEIVLSSDEEVSSDAPKNHGDCDQEEVVLSSDEEVLSDALKNYERQKLQEANQSNLKHNTKQASGNAPIHIVVAGVPFTVTRIGEVKSNSPKSGQPSTSQVESGPSSSIGVSDVSQQSTSRGVKR